MGGSGIALAEGQLPRLLSNAGTRFVAGASTTAGGQLRALLGGLCPDSVWASAEKDGWGAFSCNWKGKLRLRAVLRRQDGGWGVSLRAIPVRPATIQELNLPSSLSSFRDSEAGLFVVSGPPGSGRSTTLAALIDSINTHAHRTILAVEDSLETIHAPGQSAVIHREVGRDVLSMVDSALAAPRMDADVLLVGELRDAPTLRAALSAAESGVAVYGAGRGTSVVRSITGMIGAFDPREEPSVRAALAETVEAVCCQVLVRGMTPARHPAMEVLLRTPTISSILRSGELSQLNGAIIASRSMGMQLMDDALEDLVRQGVVAEDEAVRWCEDPKRFGG